MKKIILFSVSIISAFILFSCEQDESLDPLPVKNDGQFMKLDIQQRQLDFNDINSTYFGGTLYNTSNNVVKYELYVRRTDMNGVITDNYVLLQTITSFPYQLNITPTQIAQALGIQVSDLQDGDFYRFLGYSYDASGNKAGYLNLARSVQIAFLVEQGYRFNTSLSSVMDPEYNNRQP